MPHESSESNSPKDNHDLINTSFYDGNGVSTTQSTTGPIILDVHKGKPVRLQVKVMVPVNDHPNFNFVGKLLGPKGNSLKWLQDQTQTKMAILGRGSMRDKQKEEDLRKTGDPKYNHLNEDLHVEVTTFAPAPEAYVRMGNALQEVKRFLVPDYYDDIRQQQLRELGVLNIDKKPITKMRLNDGIGEALLHQHHHSHRDDDHNIHLNDSTGAGVTAASHLVIPHNNNSNNNTTTTTNGFSNSDCLPYNMNGENHSDLSHCWDQKSTFKLSSRHNNKGLLYRDKPYARVVDNINNIYH
ncbi:uncharacterized protein LOC128951736 [Oppia nitens]|uniref:uncharacterized protein LOC128951736 n=1 Tax=Oppia nitens TaxID=1686743 RepID=UPI0023DC1080|nr:uncharacterized protein LOC128951736 [Oppia nitens]XP_054152977.1 uncharacterized protein LOC128951736 [Oppia nitens]